MPLGFIKTFTGSAGSPLAAVGVLLSSACCVGPLSVALSWVGLSSSTLLSVENVVGPFRPFVLAGTAGLLGLSFYYAYRPLDACEPGTPCATPRQRRVQRGFTWVATAFFFVLLYFSYVHPNLDRLFGIYL